MNETATNLSDAAALLNKADDMLVKAVGAKKSRALSASIVNILEAIEIWQDELKDGVDVEDLDDEVDFERG